MCDEPPVTPRDAIFAASLVAVSGAVFAGIRAGRARAEVVAIAVLTSQSLLGAIRQRGEIHHYYIRPVVCTLAVAVLFWKGRKNLRAAVCVHAAAVVAGTILISPCSDRVWARAVDASIGPTLVVVSWTANGAWPAIVATEAIVVVVSVCSRSNADIASMASHLTWWSITSLVVVDIVTYADWLTGKSMAPIIVPTAAVLTHTVAVGVVVMSAMGCSMLADAFSSAGPVGYIAGNFAMHYYPAIRTAWAPTAADGAPAAAKAAAIVAIYAIAFAPPHVYGCPWPPIGYTAMLLVAVACAVLVVAAVHRRVFATYRAKSA